MNFDNYTDAELIQLADNTSTSPLTKALAERLDMRLRDLQDSPIVVVSRPEQMQLFPDGEHL
jgi:hypothetical protein